MIVVISNAIGILGVILLLIAYFLLQVDKILSSDYIYTGLNLVGSLLILYSLFYAWNLPAVIIETAWAIISIIGIVRRMSRKGS